MGRYGNKPLTGEQVRWGFENLNLDAGMIKALGFEGMMRPIKVTCLDHEGVRSARVQQWDGQKFVFKSEWIEADTSIIRPMVEESAAKYAAEKKIEPRNCGAQS
jgi:branched-chain amino acid transport system substrate-binding protein